MQREIHRTFHAARIVPCIGIPPLQRVFRLVKAPCSRQVDVPPCRKICQADIAAERGGSRHAPAIYVPRSVFINQAYVMVIAPRSAQREMELLDTLVVRPVSHYPPIPVDVDRHRFTPARLLII